MFMKATIEVLIEVPDDEPHKDGYAADAIAEALRPMLKAFHSDPDTETAWIDWRYVENAEEHNGEGFEYAEG